MRQKISNIVLVCLVLFMPMLLASCIYDDKDEGESPSEQKQLSVTLRIPAAQAVDGEHEVGSVYENYIDFGNAKSFRIFFFDMDNKFITQFKPWGVSKIETEYGSEYTVGGLIPSELLDRTDFKIVVLANWENYGEDVLVPGVNEISSQCRANWSQYNHLTNFNLSPDTKLIPFYGVREFKDVHFKKGNRTFLEKPISMLRAVAKVEVVIEGNADTNDNENDTNKKLSDYCESVTIHRYNDKGFCAPDGVYTHNDYMEGENVYSHADLKLHLVGGGNDSKDIDKTLECQTLDGTDNTKWVAYLPEYQNKDLPEGKEDTYSYISVKFSFRDEPFRIYFANYTDGQTDNANDKRYDIVRNCLYRFTVKLSGGKFIVEPKTWKDVFDNVFEFGEPTESTEPTE